MSRSFVPLLALLLALTPVLTLTTELTAQSPIAFTDVTTAVGIDWRQIESRFMMGAGGAFLDYDGDGWQDVLLSGGDSTPTLYRNLNGTSFQRVEHTAFPRSPSQPYICVTVGDIDNDGDPDLFFGRFGPNLLFRNDGGGVFTDITTPALRGALSEFTTTAAFGDYDSDANLDLYIGNYITLPSTYPRHRPTPNELHRGHGDGTFTDVTTPTLAGAGTALATAWTDFDSDGDVDIFVGNDFGAFVEPNQIYRNDGPAASGTAWAFSSVSRQLNEDVGIFCMGIAIGDIDRDLDFDYYVTNLGRNVLLRNDGSGFVDITTTTRTELTFDPNTSSPVLFATSWGTGFHDFDNDGWLDLYVSNGHIPAGAEIANGRQTANTVFRHDGPSLTFTELPLHLDRGVGRGAAFADYDKDGDVDVLQVNVGGAPVLMRNDSPQPGHWFASRLHGRVSNRDALGARVDLDVGAFVAAREVSRNYSFEASSSPRLHFGFGNAPRIRSATVRWPSGIEQQLYDLQVDTLAEWNEPIVTVEQARVQIRDLGGGNRLWVFTATLVNHIASAGYVFYQPQIRYGHTTPSHGPPGTTFWTGEVRQTRVPAKGHRQIRHTLLIPAGATPSSPINLDVVWTVVDPGLGVDEAKVAIEVR